MSAWPENPLFPSASIKEPPGLDVWSLSLQGPSSSYLAWRCTVLTCVDLIGGPSCPLTSSWVAQWVGLAGGGRRVHSSVDRLGPSWAALSIELLASAQRLPPLLPSGQEWVILFPAFTHPSATETLSALWETRFPRTICFLGPALTGPLGFPPHPTSQEGSVADNSLGGGGAVCDANLGEKRREGRFWQVCGVQRTQVEEKKKILRKVVMH